MPGYTIVIQETLDQNSTEYSVSIYIADCTETVYGRAPLHTLTLTP